MKNLSELNVLTSQNSGTDIVFLIGPTGVGKSFLIEQLKESLIKENMTEIDKDPSFIPVISIETPSSGEKSFSWLTFYNRLGAALNEILMDKKIENRVIDGCYKVINFSSRCSISARREAIEHAIGYRKTILIIIDEAIHLLREKRGNSLAKRMDTLKSLANIHGTSLLLVGSYDLYELMNQYGQVARRSSLVHFERYRNNVNDLYVFTNTLADLQKALPIEGLPDLRPYVDDLMLNCVGCIGTLKDTLKRTLIICLKSFEGKWDSKCLERAFLSTAQVKTIYEEVLDGEKIITGASFGTNSFLTKDTSKA